MFIWTYFDKAQAYWQSSHLEWWWRESRKREMWRFLTYSLLHSSWWHLTFNLVVQVIHQTFKLSNLFKQTFKLTYFHFPNVTLWCDVSDLPLNFYFSTLTYIVVVDPCDSSFHVVKPWNCETVNFQIDQTFTLQSAHSIWSSLWFNYLFFHFSYEIDYETVQPWQFCASDEESYDHQVGLGVPLEMVHGSGRVATIYISGVSYWSWATYKYDNNFNDDIAMMTTDTWSS